MDELVNVHYELLRKHTQYHIGPWTADQAE